MKRKMQELNRQAINKEIKQILGVWEQNAI